MLRSTTLSLLPTKSPTKIYHLTALSISVKTFEHEEGSVSSVCSTLVDNDADEVWHVNERSNSEHPGINSDVNNHHFIPRQDFGNYGGGTPSGGTDNNNDKSQEHD
ncbi:hypothetical protein POM88_029783 [Heracleum sosnowskyi]|uniref:Uncharacterized protein n=1 Tax=Heracleum sosnowskyi TaxID=360622 RepID=A0AAD8MF60_9APIA|nr:hypothetical protein POM88_029783 [Heracleum sosnowskyi]